MGRVQKFGFKNPISDVSDEDFNVGADEHIYYFDDSDDNASEESLGELQEMTETMFRRSKTQTNWANQRKTMRKNKRVSYKEESDEDDESDADDDEDKDDMEFKPYDIHEDDEGEFPAMKRKRVGDRLLMKKKEEFMFDDISVMKRNKDKGFLWKREKTCMDLKKLMTKKQKKSPRLICGKRQRTRAMKFSDSDSDSVTSGSSDYEYTISEEEREQVNEAAKICASLTSSSWSKVEEDLNKCGICLSEEGAKTVRGTIECCNHFFCFPCIMDWSKTENKCPLCKQRFSEIAKSATGFNLRPTVILVPQRSQVYEPSEEELMGFQEDPYGDMICTECFQDGDEALMLLCDQCNTNAAHTFCVGLGHQVPEADWYCQRCQPTLHNCVQGFDLNSMPVPNAPLTEEN